MRRALVAAAITLGLTSAASAGPNPPKFTRNPTVIVRQDDADRARLTRAPEKEASAPALGGDDILRLYGLTAGLREDKVTLLEQLIADTPDREVDEKAELWFRLAEAHAEQWRYYRLTSETAKAKRELIAAVKAYEALADERYRGYAEMDRALFLYGWMLQAGRYHDEARAVYQRLAKEHPGSKYVAHARFAFGEYAYEQERLRDAAEEYRAVLELPASPVTEYARYKLGWVAINLGRAEEALGLFYDVARGTRGALHRAAAKDLVRAYAELGKADKAYRYFQKVDRKLAFEMLVRLADLWLEQGRHAKAIAVYRELMALEPAHRDLCLWQYAIAEATIAGGSVGDKVAEIERLDALPAKALAPCREDAIGVTDALARQFHVEWAKTLDVERLEAAQRLYRAYLAAFPDAAGAAETAYYRAELLWSRADVETSARRKVERWEEAAAAFTAAGARKKQSAALRRVCAEAAVMAWLNAADADPRLAAVPPPSSDGAPAPRALPDREQRLIAAIAAYRALPDGDPKVVVEMTFVEAAIYRRFDHLEDAISPLTMIVRDHRDHERGPVAIDLLLHALDRLGRTDALHDWTEQLLGDAPLLQREPELAARLRGLDRTWHRKQIEACEAAAAKSRDPRAYVPCGEAYVELWVKDPDAPQADELVWNAAIDLERGHSVGSAIQLYEEVVRLYPKSPLASRALVKLGAAYGRIAWYDLAAEKLEAYARRFAGEDDAYRAMSDAVLYRKGIGDDDAAIADTRFFVATFGAKDPAAAADAWFSLTTILEKRGDVDVVIAHLRAYLRTHARAGGVTREVAAWTKIGQLLWTSACPVAGVDGACVKVARERAVRSLGRRKAARQRQCGEAEKIRTVVVARDERRVADARRAWKKAVAIFQAAKNAPLDARAAYAQARFGLAEVEYERFLAVRFPENLDFEGARAKRSMARFEAWVKAKRAAGEVAGAAYKALVADVKVPAQAIAAAARLGQIPQQLADALFTAEIPKSVRTGAHADEKIELYCDAVTDLTGPLEEAAVTAYGACLKASTRLGWSSAWSRLCERELGQIRPDEYPTASELRSVPRASAAAPVLEAALRL